MALNIFGKNLAHEEQGGHGRRPTSTDTPSPQKADGGAAESQAGRHHRNPMVSSTQGGPSNDEEVAAKLLAAAAASIEWAARSGVAFDKTEAALFHRKKSTSKATLRRGMHCTGPRAGEAARRNTTPERVTIFSDAQAAIKQMASDEPGPGQQYALQARKHIATLRKARLGITIETGGAAPTRELPATRRLMNGRRLRQRSRTPPSFVVRKQPVVARASWLTSSCSSFAWPMVPQVWSPFPALLLLSRRPASTGPRPPPPAYEKSREEDNRTGIHICTCPTPSGAYPTISRRTYTYSLRHQYSLVYLHTTRTTISTKPTPQLRTIMSAYKLRRQKEAEQRRLEARGYSKSQSVPEPLTLKKLQPASEENLQRARNISTTSTNMNNTQCPSSTKFILFPPWEILPNG